MMIQSREGLRREDVVFQNILSPIEVSAAKEKAKRKIVSARPQSSLSGLSLLRTPSHSPTKVTAKARKASLKRESRRSMTVDSRTAASISKDLMLESPVRQRHKRRASDGNLDNIFEDADKIIRKAFKSFVLTEHLFSEKGVGESSSLDNSLEELLQELQVT